MENKKCHRNIVKNFPFVDSDSLIEKIEKEYKKGVDYTVDKTGNFYTILSEKLEKSIWPNDCSPWERTWGKPSVVVDKEKKKVQKATFYVEGNSESKGDETKTEQNFVSPPLSKNSDKLLWGAGGASLFFLALVFFFLS